MTSRPPLTTPSPMIAGIDRAIALLEERAKALSAQEPEELLGRRRGVPGPEEEPRPLEELDLLIARLQQIKEHLLQEPRLLPLIDEYIGQQVRAGEKRQAVQSRHLAIVTTVAGVALGWLAAGLATPASLWHLLLR